MTDREEALRSPPTTSILIDGLYPPDDAGLPEEASRTAGREPSKVAKVSSLIRSRYVSWRARRRAQPRLKTAIQLLFFLAASAYGVNALAIYVSGPPESGYTVESYRDAEIRVYKELHVGVWPLGFGVLGYVDLSTADREFYIDSELHALHPSYVPQVYEHEYFHILQRDLIAEAAGGYPSYGNPLQSAVYYFHVLRMGLDLRPLMPEPAEGAVPNPFAQAMETSADCYAQPRGSADKPALYRGVYMDSEAICTAEQVWIVEQMAEGRWPAPAPEGTELSKLYVTSGAPWEETPSPTEPRGEDGDQELQRDLKRILARRG